MPTFLLFAVACSTNIRRINWTLVGLGLMLQVTLALLILRVDAVYEAFVWARQSGPELSRFHESGYGVRFWPTGSSRVKTDSWLRRVRRRHGRSNGQGTSPTSTVHLCVSGVACGHLCIVVLLGALLFWDLAIRGAGFSGGGAAGHGNQWCGDLSAIANVFMGQTEAPLIVKPYILGMTRSELLTLMVGGMATVSGGMMVAYVGLLNEIGLKEQTVAILATSLMAAPAGLYLAKILCPETETPQTAGAGTVTASSEHVNVVDAAAGGASDGVKLVINIIAMLIAFIAFIAMTNAFLGWIDSTFNLGLNLTLQRIFGTIFRPVAVLMGVPMADTMNVGQLLGTKLVLNEFVAYGELTKIAGQMQPRSLSLTVFALTGFANLSSVGIQLGGIGSLPNTPEEQAQLRGRLAKLGLRALLGGFLATVLNATIAGISLGF